jgi:MFS superfamily sulfate permease-like transporter
MTVALVSLPLSISLAIAADALPVQGCITAVWAGLISAVFGGSHYNIVGPTGALSGILSYYSLKYAAYPGILPMLAILAGCMSLLVYASGMDRFLVFIPGAVMHGFTLGVAFIITANQLNFLLGLPKLQRHPEFLANMGETFSNLQNSSPLAICFFAVSFYMLFNLVKKYGKIPWAVVLAIAGIILGMALENTNLRLQTIKTRYGDLSIQLISWLDTATLPALSVETLSDLMRGSVSIAAVAVLETLISARIADRMTKTIFNQPAEVLSVGLTNLGSGFTGGIPATAALARTALNVKSGATSRGSGIVSAIFIALLCSVLFSSFKYLPLPVVATILVNTAYRMVEWHEIHTLIVTDRPMMVVTCVTAIICAVQDPTMGIVYGTGFSMVRILLTLMHGHSHLFIYQGAKIELSVEFQLNNGAEAVAGVRAKYLKERDATEVHKEKMRMEKAEAVASSTNAIAAAASALRVAEEDARSTTMALSAAASGKGIKKQMRSLAASPLGKGPGGQGEEEGGETEEEPAFLKGVDPMPGDERLPRVAVYGLPGYCTYVGAKSHLDRIRGLFIDDSCIPGIDVICFEMTDIKYADPDALEAIGDVVDVRWFGAALFV